MLRLIHFLISALLSSGNEFVLRSSSNSLNSFMVNPNPIKKSMVVKIPQNSITVLLIWTPVNVLDINSEA